MKKTTILIFAIFILWGCSQSKSKPEGLLTLMDTYDGAVATEEVEFASLEVPITDENIVAGETSIFVNSQSAIDKKIIRTGSIQIQSENIQKSRNELETILNETKSYVQRENFHNNSYRENLQITIRVPNQYFDSLTNSLQSNGIGIIRSKNISSSDVTEDYYDIEIRLKNKELYLEKYRDFLAKAETVKDMLEVQEKIRNMEEEIESAKGRLRFIDDKVNFSTLDINLYKEKPAISGASEVGFFGRLWASIVTGWNLLAGIFFGLLSIWSILLIGGVVIWGIVRIRKNRRNRKSKIVN